MIQPAIESFSCKKIGNNYEITVDGMTANTLLKVYYYGTLLNTTSPNDYGGFEKVGALGFSLPSSDTDITTEAGDIMLYTNNQLCIFFDSNSWQYTRIGKIEGMTKDQLKNTFGDGQVNITLSL